MKKTNFMKMLSVAGGLSLATAKASQEETTMSDDVTEADRDAAADYLIAAPMANTLLVLRIRKGEEDAYQLVQAFARHRHQATADLQAQLAEARADNERLRNGLQQVRREMRRGADNIMGIETEAMNGDNLAVSLCTYFERHDEDVCDDGWTPAATEAYEAIREAIKARFAPVERLIDTLTGDAT